MSPARKFATATGVAAALVFLFYFERDDADIAQPPARLNPSPAQPALAPPKEDAPPESALPETKAAPPVARPETRASQAKMSRFVGSPGYTAELPPDKAIEVLRATFHTYGQRFHGNPVGNNAEITAALNGKNPQQARFLGEDPALNEKGELVDGWGTPYFFHQLSGDDMEIHSAGPDKTMWTPDDLVAR